MPERRYNLRYIFTLLALALNAFVLHVPINGEALASNCNVNMSVRNISAGSKIAAVLDWKVRASPHWSASEARIRYMFGKTRTAPGETFNRTSKMINFGCGVKRAMRVHLYCHSTRRSYTYNVDQGRYIRPRDVIISVDCDAPQMAVEGLKKPKVQTNNTQSAPNDNSSAGPVAAGLTCKGYRISGCYYTSHGQSRSTQWIRFYDNGVIKLKGCNNKTGKCWTTDARLSCTALGHEAGYNGNGYKQDFTFTGRKLQNKLAHQVVWDIKTSYNDGSKPPSYVQSIFNKTRNSACK